MKLVVGITGSTGVIYGIRLLEILKRLNIETHLVMSQWLKNVFQWKLTMILIT